MEFFTLPPALEIRGIRGGWGHETPNSIIIVSQGIGIRHIILLVPTMVSTQSGFEPRLFMKKQVLYQHHYAHMWHT